jgi:hypothetical protein
MTEETPKRVSRRWTVIVGAVVGLVCLALIAAGYALKPTIRRIIRHRVETSLRAQFQSSVQFSDFHIVLLPRVRVVINDLIVRHHGRTDIPPLIEVRQVTVNAGLSAFLGKRHEIGSVRLEGLQIHMPPRDSGGPSLPHGTDEDFTKKYPIVIDEVDADDALVVILRKHAGEPPNEFVIHKLVMNNVDFEQPVAFHALLTNPKPRGEIHCDGEFGPWQADQPSETPGSGNYVFRDADLGALKGVSGTLTSTGTFSGPLDYLKVEGATDTPNFALRTSAHPLALHTDFSVIVDGTNGNTIFTNVTAKFLHTTLVTHGEVVAPRPNVKGPTIILDVVSDHARIEDLLLLTVKVNRPVMTGSAQLEAKILFLEGDEDLMERMQLTGQFGLGEVHFTNSVEQSKVDSLSRRGQGKPKDLDVSDEVSDLQAYFRMERCNITFSNLSFHVEGASVALVGTYNLDGGQMDFHGNLWLQAKLSQTTTGWRSVVLKPFDKHFTDNHGATEIPIKITGTRENPSFGFKANRNRKQRLGSFWGAQFAS